MVYVLRSGTLAGGRFVNVEGAFAECTIGRVCHSYGKWNCCARYRIESVWNKERG